MYRQCILVTRRIIRQDDLSAAVAYLNRQPKLDNLTAMDEFTILVARPVVTRRMILLDRFRHPFKCRRQLNHTFLVKLSDSFLASISVNY